MLKRISSALVIFLFCVSMIGSVFKVDAHAEGSRSYVIDNADLLDASQERKLNAQLEKIQKNWQFDVVILTVYSTGEKDVTAYADDFFDYEGYGPDGILLLIDMGSRQWALSTAGTGIEAFTDAGQEYIQEQFKPYLSAGKFYKAFKSFADNCDLFLKKAAKGHPYDVGYLPKAPLPLYWIPLSIGIGMIFAFLVCQSSANSLKTIHRQPHAGSYVKKDSLKMAESRDLFLYRNITRTRRETQEKRSGSGGGGGGSSVHTSSSGRSHGGSSGSF